MMETKINIKQMIQDMKPGEVICFPIDKLAYIRTISSIAKAITGKEYSVTTNRSEQKTEVSCLKLML